MSPISAQCACHGQVARFGNYSRGRRLDVSAAGQVLGHAAYDDVEQWVSLKFEGPPHPHATEGRAG